MEIVKTTYQCVATGWIFPRQLVWHDYRFAGYSVLSGCIARVYSGRQLYKKDFVIVSKKVSTLGTLVGKSSTFSTGDVAEIEEQPFTKSVGRFLPSQFKVSAGMGMQGIRMSTDMFSSLYPTSLLM